MKNKSASVLIALGLFAVAARGLVPSTELYPFPGFDLEVVRAKTAAEALPASADLQEAWRLKQELQGSWAPDARKPKAATLAKLDQLKSHLEALPKPDWFLEVFNSPEPRPTRLADKIGDATFVRQRATPEYQALKSLAIVYLTEHELDRPAAAQSAGRFLTALSITHPWDWEVHGLHARFLVDSQRFGPAWVSARQSLFLNPAPDAENLKFFAFVGSISAKEKWPEIQIAMQQAALDSRVADRAITESALLFS
ncbi:MAG: hypothetical protein ABIV50_06380, partial [Opitutus sp.]